MACGGFTCSKNALAALNVLYILVALILISFAGYSKAVAVITSIGVIGGIIACGVFLLLIAIVGLVGAVKHHQVLLFFYMIILFLLFLLQFSIACACLAMNESQRDAVLKKGWEIAPSDVREATQKQFQCCGFDKAMQSNYTLTGSETDKLSHPPCGEIPKCQSEDGTVKNITCCVGKIIEDSPACPVDPCEEVMQETMARATKAVGGVGLFFSFTEIIGVWLALRFRNQKDPRANPSAFL